jgi:hypothetical protein
MPKRAALRLRLSSSSSTVVAVAVGSVVDSSLDTVVGGADVTGAGYEEYDSDRPRTRLNEMDLLSRG